MNAQDRAQLVVVVAKDKDSYSLLGGTLTLLTVPIVVAYMIAYILSVVNGTGMPTLTEVKAFPSTASEAITLPKA